MRINLKTCLNAFDTRLSPSRLPNQNEVFYSFQTNLNKTVNLNQNFYRENYPRIWSVCEEGGREAWKDICPIQPYHVSWWRGRLEENAFLGAGRGKTRHRKAGLRKIAPNPNQVLMWPKRNYPTTQVRLNSGMASVT